MKYEFASREWCAVLHGLIAERAAWEVKSKPNLAMSICEVFTNAPAHMADADGKVAWSCVIEDGRVDFQIRERDDVKFKVVGEYAAILPLGQYDTHGDPARAAELGTMAAKALESGGMKTTGERIANPQAITSIHDAIARLTL